MTLKLRGVNLGGWLVLERWMTPSLFAGTDARDEYTFMQTAGAADKIERHRQRFITEADFRWLHGHGINAIRIPIGYWVFDGDGPYTPTIRYLDWAVKMAGTYQLQVLIDLHGAKGSQNGHDHSGRAGRAAWFHDVSARRQTIDVLTRLATRYHDASQVWGIELLNEPKVGILHWKLRRFYRQAYRAITKVTRPGFVIVFSDGFRPRLMNGALRGSAAHPVVMDIHWYHFGSVLARWRPLEGYFRLVAGRAALIRRLQRRQPVIIGEWSAVLSHQSTRGLSARERQALTQRHIARQIQAYQAAAGWFYWSYKTEAPGRWNFRSMVEDKKLVLK